MCNAVRCRRYISSQMRHALKNPLQERKFLPVDLQKEQNHKESFPSHELALYDWVLNSVKQKPSNEEGNANSTRTTRPNYFSLQIMDCLSHSYPLGGAWRFLPYAFSSTKKSVLIASRMAVLKTRSCIEKQWGKFNHFQPNIPYCIVNRDEKCDLTLSWWQSIWIAKIGNLRVTKTANKQ